MKQFIVHEKYLAAKPVFEVPVVRNAGGTIQGRVPRRFPASFFYTTGATRCAIVVSEAGARYLAQRRYATYLGRARYQYRPGRPFPRRILSNQELNELVAELSYAGNR